jgi:hypothetical protein
MRSFVILDRTTAEEEIELYGCRLGNVMLVCQKGAFMTNGGIVFPSPASNNGAKKRTIMIGLCY